MAITAGDWIERASQRNAGPKWGIDLAADPCTQRVGISPDWRKRDRSSCSSSSHGSTNVWPTGISKHWKLKTSTSHLFMCHGQNTGWRLPDWWFGTFFIFQYIWNNHPNWLLLFRGVGIPPTSFSIRHGLFCTGFTSRTMELPGLIQNMACFPVKPWLYIAIIYPIWPFIYPSIWYIIYIYPLYTQYPNYYIYIYWRSIHLSHDIGIPNRWMTHIPHTMFWPRYTRDVHYMIYIYILYYRAEVDRMRCSNLFQF